MKMAISTKDVGISTLLSIALAWITKSLFPSQPFIPLLIPLLFTIAYLAFFSGNANAGSNTPPGPTAIPVFGNWLQVGNDLNHRFLARMAAKYGPVFLLRLGVRNLVVVSDPRLATEVLHTQVYIYIYDMSYSTSSSEFYGI